MVAAVRGGMGKKFAARFWFPQSIILAAVLNPSVMLPINAISFFSAFMSLPAFPFNSPSYSFFMPEVHLTVLSL